MSMLVRGGKTILAFQHRRLREFPPEGGIGVLCEALGPQPDLVEHSRRLLQEMRWEGVAMVEYRMDPATGRYALMEVNGRFWGSLPTAIHAGADFQFWLYQTCSRFSFSRARLPNRDPCPLSGRRYQVVDFRSPPPDRAAMAGVAGVFGGIPPIHAILHVCLGRSKACTPQFSGQILEV